VKRPSVYQYILTFAILMLFWYILSGYLEFFYIGAGIVCCGIVTLISGDLVFRSDVRIARSAHVFIRFILYIPRLLAAILHANLDVAYRVLHPEMPIDPGIVTVDTPFRGDVLRTSFANAVTLTPGTVTVDVIDGRFIVHALVREAGEEDLLKGRSIERDLARVFGEGDQPPSGETGDL
jgi:multicomponent Na+:H+ antiporter subunit E